MPQVKSPQVSQTHKSSPKPEVSNVSLHMLCYFCLFGLCLALFSVFFLSFCLLWRLLGRFLGQNMPKCLDPGCPRVLLSYGFPRNSLVCLGSADVSKKCSQMSKMSSQSVQDDPQSSPKSAKEGPNEAQRHPMSATRVPKDPKKTPQRSQKRAKISQKPFPRAQVRPQAPQECQNDLPSPPLKSQKPPKSNL